MRKKANDLAGVSGKLKQILSSLLSGLAAIGPAWGSDGTGTSFANGSGGYVAQMNSVTGSMHAKTDLLDEYAEVMRRTADTLQQQDGH